MNQQPTTTSTTIHLTLDSKYVPTWGMKEGLRELIQNWLDAGGTGRPEHADGQVVLENPGASMGREVLLIGHSTKPGTDARGQFGEGLKLGALALLRDGCSVSVQAGGETWRAKLDAHPILGQTVLAWDILDGGEDYDGVRVIVGGITGDDWASMRRIFIWDCDHTQSSLLQSRDLQGAVYVKGIHVLDHPNLALGYNFHDLKTDRDRKLVDNYQLGIAANRVMLQALQKGEVSGEAVLGAYDKATHETAVPDGNFKLDEGGRQTLTEAWLQKNPDTVPCGAYEWEVEKHLRTLGKKAVCISNQLLGFLDVPDGQAVLTDLKDGRIAHTMSPQEERGLKWAISMIEAAHGDVPRIEVSKFTGSRVGSVFESESSTLHLNADSLKSKTLALCQIAKGLDLEMPPILDHILETSGVVRA